MKGLRLPHSCPRPSLNICGSRGEGIWKSFNSESNLGDSKIYIVFADDNISEVYRTLSVPFWSWKLHTSTWIENPGIPSKDAFVFPS